MPIRVVFFDCDGTLTTIRSSWEYLHRRLDLWDNNADAYQAMFRKGLISYEEFCDRDALLWKGLSTSKIDEIVGDVPLQDGAASAVRILKDLGIYTIIISSGLSFLVDRVKRLLHIDQAFSNQLEAIDGCLTGRTIINVPYNCKGQLVKSLLDFMGLTRAESCAIGDGDGDAGMFEEVGVPIHLSCEDLSANGPISRHANLLSAVSFVREHGH